MKLSRLFSGLALAALPLWAGSPVAAQDMMDDPPPIGPMPMEAQIAFAVQAAPAAMRDDATVQGYDASGAFVTLRQGSNELICMAPNPESVTFEVSCHHADLEPFFERGRELRAAGITGNERVQKRFEEIEAGTLPMPYGATNYILRGEGFDVASATIENSYLRWVIYTPFATPETTGLSTDAQVSAPWLMFPGTAGSHIMISPPTGG
jgi:hypothetical protein